ncbi:fungal-specific transcription factor domain-containing protein [Plectosphaerella plurivora]|uniref:Fungal-specific transcription factor domain-containing protein n=1 Tax=Plectosphaerella plurivora TaxID=936078 RepID=A0A9P8VM73_9PEZI|nr:fungal-specific transcription factor domain-containing protein [Plectosphaerella plurivora]
MAPSQTQTPSSRSANACEQCRKRKVKCSGDQPCRSCSRHRLQCTFGSAGRRRFSEAHVQGLLETIKQYEEQLNAQSTTTTPRVAATVNVHARAISPASDDGLPEPITFKEVPVSIGSKTSPAGTTTEQASGPAFESRVRSLFHSHTEGPTSVSPGEPPVVAAVAGVSPDGSEWCSTVDLVDGAAATLDLPSESEAHRLLELFLMHMGTNQHFLDLRNFSDSLTMLYQSPAAQQKQKATMWFTQYLLIMAMGKLMDDDTASSRDLPGAPYFAEAMRRLPPLHRLGSCGIIAVEILCLITTYLQWCDRRHDAYLYIGTAVRLAIALGCSLKASDQQCLPSERAHRVRVWWTAYMLDRRLSAALGLPSAADNRQISLELPGSAPGFQSAQALNVNVRIAHVTGDIMTSLYGNTALSELDLVRKIQSILKSLHDTGQSIPRKYIIDFSKKDLAVSRTGASLYLMLYQAVILCIRPLILQKVKAKVEGSPQSEVVSNTSNLCHSCTEASIKSIQILSTLQRQNQLARFGFFDLDATFSAAFILIMKGFIHGTKSPPAELRLAGEALGFLSREGNKAARQRLSDMMQLSSHVWSPQVVSDTWAGIRSQGPPGDPGLAKFNVTSAEESIAALHRAQREADASNQGQQPFPTLADMPPWDDGGAGQMDLDGDAAFLGLDLTNSFGPELDLAAPGIYSSFNDPGLPLTGVDHLDWAEIEKMFASRSA